MRLIDADALIEQLNPEYLETRKLIEQGETHLDNLAEGYTEIYRLIKAAPTIDAAPVRHGQWIYGTCGCYKLCSSCDNLSDFYFDYCPNCGAKMDEVSE